MEDLNNNITESEVAVDDSTTVNVESSEVEVETYSAEDYKKGLQSAASKAKYEILKELGINSVKEFQDLKLTYDNAISSKTELEKTIASLNTTNSKLQEDLMLNKLGVAPEYTEDLLTLARSRVDESHNLEEVSKQLLERYPQWKVSDEKIAIGTPKSSNKAEYASQAEEYLAKYSKYGK